MLGLITAATLVRLGFAWALGLGVDESYMVTTGRTLRLGYFDHPPAAWWLQLGATHLFGTEAPIAVRAPFILLFALSTWLMYRLGTAYADRRAGLWAAVAFTLSPVFGVTTASWVLPDGPLDAALLAAALALARALPAQGRAAVLWWLAAGLCAGLALFSKYTAVLTLGGAFLYLLTSKTHRRWLARPEPHVAALLAFAVFAPVLAWNATHHWASFAFQGDRAEGLQLRPWGPLVVLAGEALFVLPWIWLPMMVAFVAALRRGPAEWRGWLLCCLGAPPIVVFALIALWSSGRVLFHWAAPGYLMLFPLLGAWIAARIDQPAIRRVIGLTAGFIAGALVLVSTEVRLGWLQPAFSVMAKHDPDVEAIDWVSVRHELAARGLLVGEPIIAAADWRDAGKLSYALGPEATVVCLCTDARQFGLNKPVRDFVGQSMLVVITEHATRAVANLAPFFVRIEPLPPLMLRQDDRNLQAMALFRAIDLRRWPEER